MAAKGREKKDGRNRIKLSPSEEQMQVFRALAEADERPLAEWALRRLWKAVQDEARRKS